MQQKRSRRSRRYRRPMPPWLPLIPTVLLAAGIGLYYGATDGFYVPSESMEPTLQKGDQFRAEVWHSLQEGPKRGQIWVLHNPRPIDDNGPYLVKRVVGLPGEKIAVAKGKLLIDGKPLEERYVQEPIKYMIKPVTLGADEYWLLGDNRNNSQDSHAWGPAKRKGLMGRAFVLYWPFEHFKWL